MLPGGTLTDQLPLALVLTVCVLLFQVCLKTYDTLWRYAESREYLTLLEGMERNTIIQLLKDTAEARPDMLPILQGAGLVDPGKAVAQALQMKKQAEEAAAAAAAAQAAQAPAAPAAQPQVAA